MKKPDSAMVALLLSFTLCACSAPEPEPAPGAAARTQRLTVDFPQGIEPLSSAPRSIRLNEGLGATWGHAETWDGRVFIAGFGAGRWEVTVFRPEVLQAQGGAVPSFPAGAFSPRRILDETGAVTGLGAGNQNAIAIRPATRARNPYPCRSDWVEDPASTAFDCYELMVYAQKYTEIPTVLGQFPVGVMVSAPRTASAAVAAVVPRGGFTPLRVGRWRSAGVVGAIRPVTEPLPPLRTDSRLIGIEPSLTLDGRLLIWNGDDRNTRLPSCPQPPGTACRNLQLNIVYSWNETPDNPETWTEPASLTDMYYYDRAVALGGVRFDQLFPIAQQPLRAADGYTYPDDRYLVGAYPWIDLDGANLVYTAVKSSPESEDYADPALRAALSIIGRATSWTARHIDGAPNTSRLRKRTFFSSPGAFPGMWAPYPNLRDPTAPLPIPYTPARPVLPLFGSQTDDYSEVSLEDATDGDYVLFLHMNELVKVAEVDAADGRGTSSRYDLPWTAGVNPHSADTSGNFNTGELIGGAVFPGEDRPAPSPGADPSASNPVGCMNGSTRDLDNDGKIGCADPDCFFSPLCARVTTRETSCDNGADDDSDGAADCADADCVDNMGFCASTLASAPLPKPGKVGQSIVFSPGSYLRVAPSSSHATPDALSVELWVYAGSGPSACFGSGYTLIDKPGTFRVALDAQGRVTASVESFGTRAVQSPAAIACRSWTHVAFTYESSSGVLALYLGGDQVRRTDFDPGRLGTQSGDISIGPRSSAAAPAAVLAIDEVKVSRVARSAREIARSAFRPRPPVRLDNRLPSGLSLPAGVLAQDLRIPEDNPWNTSAIALGERLFYDTRLSRNGAMACVTCHEPARDFTDTNALGRGVDGRPLPRRASMAANRAFGVLQFWDGRAASLEAQTTMPIENPDEMGLTMTEVLDFLGRSQGYATAFANAFPLEGLSRTTVEKALAQYLRSRLFGGSPGDSASSAGKTLFFGKARCSACHSGSNYSDELFHVTRTARNLSGDLGRWMVTGRGRDAMAFKTPSLRDVGRRNLFFHDGSATSLEEVVALYDEGGRPGGPRDPEIRPLGLSPQERADLVVFLRSLSSQPFAGATPPAPYAWQPPELAQLRNPAFDADVSFWTVVRGHYDSADPNVQAWLDDEVNLRTNRLPSERGLVRLRNDGQTAWIEQTLRLPVTGAPRDLRARVSQLLPGGTTQFTLEVVDGGVPLARGQSAVLGFADGWVTIGWPGNLVSCGSGAPCAGRTITIRLRASAGPGAAPGISDVRLY